MGADEVDVCVARIPDELSPVPVPTLPVPEPEPLATPEAPAAPVPESVKVLVIVIRVDDDPVSAPEEAEEVLDAPAVTPSTVAEAGEPVQC
jgi:hypothetical protein